MKAHFNAQAAILDRATVPSLSLPRYLVIDAKGVEFLLADDRTPLYRRPARSAPGELVDPATRLPRIVSQRDLWVGGSSPAHDPASGWEVRQTLRLWKLWPEG